VGGGVCLFVGLMGFVIRESGYSTFDPKSEKLKYKEKR
jgi:hypothetical protein